MKPIRMTDADRRQALLDFENFLASNRGCGEYNLKYKAQDIELDENIILNFTALAWLKMDTLIQKTSTECAWHGVVTASDDRKCFTVTDILVYPQHLAATTVEQDDTNNRYDEWHNALPDGIYNSLKLQGHSHVNMTSSPSGRDNDTMEKVLSTLRDDSFYIFIINNKSQNVWAKIYDLKNNACYENADINVLVDGIDFYEWYHENKEQYMQTRTSHSSTKSTGVNSLTAKDYGTFRDVYYEDVFQRPTVTGFFNPNDPDDAPAQLTPLETSQRIIENSRRIQKEYDNKKKGGKR